MMAALIKTLEVTFGPMKFDVLDKGVSEVGEGGMARINMKISVCRWTRLRLWVAVKLIALACKITCGRLIEREEE
jgi:hypothetical protein